MICVDCNRRILPWQPYGHETLEDWREIRWHVDCDENPLPRLPLVVVVLVAIATVAWVLLNVLP